MAASVIVEYPTEFPGVPRGWWYLKRGFELIGCDVRLSKELTECGYWSPPNMLPGPVHVAPIVIDGTLVWYDVSDFTPSHPELGQPYFAKNALVADSDVQPIGQYLGTHPEWMLVNLPYLRKLSQDKTIDVLAVFSNIDERLSTPANKYHVAVEGVRNTSGLRRQVVEALSGRDGMVTGLWRWAAKRPAVPANILAERVDHVTHWERIARSRIVICLPGVGGDSTRLRTEALAVGSCVLTVEGPQDWPGEWCDAWVEAERGADGVVTELERLLADPDRIERTAASGRAYFESTLRPERMAERMIRACA